jgi:hypothetical protein
MNIYCTCWLFTYFSLWILIFKELTARRQYWIGGSPWLCLLRDFSTSVMITALLTDTTAAKNVHEGKSYELVGVILYTFASLQTID